MTAAGGGGSDIGSRRRQIDISPNQSHTHTSSRSHIVVVPDCIVQESFAAFVIRCGDRAKEFGFPT